MQDSLEGLQFLPIHWSENGQVCKFWNKFLELRKFSNIIVSRMLKESDQIGIKWSGPEEREEEKVTQFRSICGFDFLVDVNKQQMKQLN